MYRDGITDNANTTPKINCSEIGTHIIKNYTSRITTIETVINEFLILAKSASTRAFKLLKTHNFYY